MNSKKPRNAEFLVRLSFVVIGVVVVLVAIIGSWLWNLIFDPTHFDVNVWANRAIFNTSISLAMMVLGFIAFNEGSKAKTDGKYSTRLEHFQELVGELFASKSIVYFDQFIIWYSAKQLRDKKIKYLTRNGVSVIDAQLIVDNATIDDIPTITGLKSEVVTKKVLWFTFEKKIVPEAKGNKGEDIVRKNDKGEDILIPAVNDKLAYYLEQVLDGSIFIEVEDSSYYMEINKNKSSNLTSLERAQNTEKDRVSSMRNTFISAAISGVIVATLIALLVVDQNQGVGTAEAIWNLLARLITATAGFITGGFAGLTNVSYLYKFMGDKIKVINEYNTYLSTNQFVPKTYNEIIQEKIEERKEK